MATLSQIVQVNPSTLAILDSWDFPATARGIATDGRNFYVGNVPVANQSGTFTQYRLAPGGLWYNINVFGTPTKSTGIRGITFLGAGRYFLLTQSLVVQGTGFVAPAAELDRLNATAKTLYVIQSRSLAYAAQPVIGGYDGRNYGDICFDGRFVWYFSPSDPTTGFSWRAIKVNPTAWGAGAGDVRSFIPASKFDTGICSMNGLLVSCTSKAGPIHEVNFYGPKGELHETVDVTNTGFTNLHGIEFDGAHLYLLYTA